MRVKIGPLDKIFSQYIRTRDGWCCQRCGKAHARNSQGLHAAHIFGRGKHSTRWHENNAVSLCYGDHSYLDQNPLEKYKWYKEKFGTALFDQIKELSEKPIRFTKEQKKELKEHYKQKLKALL